jgi:hypothetical protein
VREGGRSGWSDAGRLVGKGRGASKGIRLRPTGPPLPRPLSPAAREKGENSIARRKIGWGGSDPAGTLRAGGRRDVPAAVSTAGTGPAGTPLLRTRKRAGRRTRPGRRVRAGGLCAFPSGEFIRSRRRMARYRLRSAICIGGRPGGALADAVRCSSRAWTDRRSGIEFSSPPAVRGGEAGRGGAPADAVRCSSRALGFAPTRCSQSSCRISRQSSQRTVTNPKTRKGRA